MKIDKKRYKKYNEEQSTVNPVYKSQDKIRTSYTVANEFLSLRCFGQNLMKSFVKFKQQSIFLPVHLCSMSCFCLHCKEGIVAGGFRDFFLQPFFTFPTNCNDFFLSGKPCADGSVSTCEAAHGSRCQDNGLNWHCLDGICHCSKLQTCLT